MKKDQVMDFNSKLRCTVVNAALWDRLIKMCSFAGWLVTLSQVLAGAVTAVPNSSMGGLNAMNL